LNCAMPPTKRSLNELPYTFNLCTGKYIHSGRTYEHETIRCNLSKTDLQDAYKSGSQQCDFDLKAKTQEHCTLPKEDIERLKKEGVNIDDIKWEEDEESYLLDSKSVCQLWLAIAKLGNPQLKWDFEKIDIFVGGEALCED